MNKPVEVETERIGTYSIDTEEEGVEWGVAVNLDGLTFKTIRTAATEVNP